MSSVRMKTHQVYLRSCPNISVICTSLNLFFSLIFSDDLTVTCHMCVIYFSGLLGSASEHFRGLPEWSSFRVKTPVGARDKAQSNLKDSS